MQVMKFGGSSVADAARMSKVVEIVTKAAERDRIILVCSAISQCTDTLIEIGQRAAQKDLSYIDMIDALQTKHTAIIKEFLSREKQKEAKAVCDKIFENIRGIAQGVCLLGELSPTSLDAIQGCGELLSTKILFFRFASLGLSCKWIDSRDIVKTSSVAGKNVVDMDVTSRKVADMIDDNPAVSLFVVPGYIASDAKGRMTTLGRGGSDYSASLFAVGCKARILEIWTDVPGMMTANPKVVPAAMTIPNISYRAALELSHFGAKVIYPPTIQPVVSEGIPIYVRNTFDPQGSATVIEKNPPLSKFEMTGISNSDNIALLSLEGSGMVGIPGFSSRLFDTFSRNDINIILITQASSVHTMCIAVSEKDAAKAKLAADETFAYEISLGKLNPLKVETGFSIICLVGDDITRRSGTTGRMLAALGRRRIPVRATAQGSSERNISIIVQSQDAEVAIRAIHEEFFERQVGCDINLFLAGCGTVGSALIDIIAKNRARIAARTGKRLKLVGISNSRHYLIDRKGLNMEGLKEQLEDGPSAAESAYFNALAEISLENSVFIDCTASTDIAFGYVNLFKHGYNVVACNKISFSTPYSQYQILKKSAYENDVFLRYETTVGAALPILESIARSLNSGDEIHHMEAVLSGTLNYLFSNYKGREGESFEAIVERAHSLGYTEPDPKIDLSGRDVMRKLLILSREAGIPLEENEVQVTPLPEKEEDFVKLYEAAQSHGCRLRYVASLSRSDDGYVATMGLQEVAPEHPFYNLCGTDNSAIIQTDFYPSPLVIQGAGAGASQTASGILNDILI